MHVKGPQDQLRPRCHGELARSGSEVAAAHPHVARLLARIAVGPAVPLQQSPVRRRHAREASSSARTWGRIACGKWEEWLRAEGYEYRFRRKRWRTWTRPDRPGEGLRPDGIEEDEDPNAYPSGASINVSLWGLDREEVPGTGERAQAAGQQQRVSGDGEAVAGDRKRDRKWREYQESWAAEAAQGAKGGTPAPSPPRANGGHHPGSTTLGDYIQVAKQTQGKSRPAAP